MSSKSNSYNLFFVLLIMCCHLYVLQREVTAEDKNAGKIEFTFTKKKSGGEKGSVQFAGNRLETKHAIIQYQSQAALRKFNRKIDYSYSGTGLGGLFAGTQTDMKSKIIQKIDALYQRVQEILDMRKRGQKKLIIDLYDDKKELGKRYKILYGGTLNARAWYVFELNTIFINSNDVHEGMLAHEMAHSIIDNFLTVRPPRATAEILAVYVDTHLFRRTKKYNTFQ